MVKRDVIPSLAVVGALAINWLNTTHGDVLGHDHHCPLVRQTFDEALNNRPITPRDPERCRCGWATFYRAYLDITNEPVTGEERVSHDEEVDRMSRALQRAGALSKSHMTYHDLARDVLLALNDGRTDLGAPTRPIDCECPGRSLNGHNDGCPRKEARPWA